MALSSSPDNVQLLQGLCQNNIGACVNDIAVQLLEVLKLLLFTA